MPKSDIVFGSEFSPAVVQLDPLLAIVEECRPDRRRLQKKVDETFFKGKGKTDDPRKTLGDNTVLSLTAYGIITRSGDAYDWTDFGRSLLEQRHSPEHLSELVGRRCLLHLDGVRVLQAIRDVSEAGEKLSKLTITRRLREQGLHIPENGKHLNILRQWLEYGGILNPDHAEGGEQLWQPDDARVSKLIGASLSEIDEWGSLSPAQRDFAKAFALMGVESASSSQIRDEAVSLFGTSFPEGGLPQSILHRLQEVGLIAWQKMTTGRGAKAHQVTATEKLTTSFLKPLLDQIGDKLESGQRRLLRMPLPTIMADLRSSDRHKKGIALEALALYFTRRLDLEFVRWRLRSALTGGAEVDLIVEGKRLIFSRWQIQCKNSRLVSLEDLAKEVGIATAIRSSVILLITTGSIGDTVREFAKIVMQNTALHIALLGAKDMDRISKDVSNLIDILNSQAAQAMKMKRVQLGE
jgi:hypothetical protein